MKNLFGKEKKKRLHPPAEPAIRSLLPVEQPAEPAIRSLLPAEQPVVLATRNRRRNPLPAVQLAVLVTRSNSVQQGRTSLRVY